MGRGKSLSGLLGVRLACRTFEKCVLDTIVPDEGKNLLTSAASSCEEHFHGWTM